MKGLVSILFALLPAAPCVVGGVMIFPAPQRPGVVASPYYLVEVHTPGGWQLSYVNFNPARTDGSGAGDQPGRSMSWTTFHIHADDDAFKLYHTGGRVKDCVVWQNSNGAVFQFGWFAKTVRDVRVHGLDVIHNENWYGVNQRSRAVFNYADAGGKGVIEDIHFDDIAIEGKILRAFGFKPMSGQVLRDWHFKNLSVGGFGAGQLGAPGRNYFIGDITDFHFDGFRVGGKTITSPDAGQFDFGPGAGSGFEFN